MNLHAWPFAGLNFWRTTDMLHYPKLTSIRAAIFWTILASTAAASLSRAAEPVVQPAVDGILAAFDTHPLVGLGELHMLANELTFYNILMREPRFAAEVGNVVVEFGASQHQDILDRYLNGENIAYNEIAKVWRNTVNWSPTLTGVGYQTFFAQVRAVNQSLPPEQRIRVWLSEPPIDWLAIKNHEEWQQIYDQREYHAAEVIKREILDRNRKALVIYGTGHFFSYPWPSTWPAPSAGTETLGEIIERTHPDSFFFVTPYGGYQNPDCSAAFEAEMNWPKRVLVSPVRDTPLQDALMQPECMSKLEGLDPPLPADELMRLERRFYEIDSGVAGDALLFIAPAAELKMTPEDPAIWMDLAYYAEISRRQQLKFGEPMAPLSATLPSYALPPQPWTRP
jgi:hypothetical protein